MPKKKPGILLVAFGSTTPLGDNAISHFELTVRQHFPNIPVRWAFTSNMIRDRLAKARVKSDSVSKALERMYFERFTHVAVQSLHLIPGLEYEQLQEDCRDVQKEKGLYLSLGTPLLTTEKDVQEAAQALLFHLPEGRSSRDAVICMGHGTRHTGAASYEALAEAMKQAESPVYIGTLEGQNTIDVIIPQLAERNIDTVWLQPLLSVVGKHAQEDMAGTKADSWQSKLTAAGFKCKAVLKGTAEFDHFIAIWLTHLHQAMLALKL